MKGKVIIKGFLDPRIGDELVLGEIETNIDKPYEAYFLGAELTKGFPFREWFIIWEDGKRRTGMSCSGPVPKSSIPDRKAFKAVVSAQ